VKASRAEIAKAARLFEEFREKAPRTARVVNIQLPKAAALMGRVRAIEYDTTHGSKVTKYRHDFAVGSAPYLAAAPGKRGGLLLFGGRFHVTARGIVDLDGNGHEIEHTRRKRTRI
jgi:hypothetical protein